MDRVRIFSTRVKGSKILLNEKLFGRERLGHNPYLQGLQRRVDGRHIGRPNGDPKSSKTPTVVSTLGPPLASKSPW